MDWLNNKKKGRTLYSNVWVVLPVSHVQKYMILLGKKHLRVLRYQRVYPKSPKEFQHKEQDLTPAGSLL
jgi:hypothetical protein